MKHDSLYPGVGGQTGHGRVSEGKGKRTVTHAALAWVIRLVTAE